jgi:hypothetical protein
MNAELSEYRKKYEQKSLETLKNIMVVKYNATEDFETDRITEYIQNCQVIFFKLDKTIKQTLLNPILIIF